MMKALVSTQKAQSGEVRRLTKFSTRGSKERAAMDICSDRMGHNLLIIYFQNFLTISCIKFM